MAPDAAVGVHVGDDVEGRGCLSGLVGQEALEEPFGQELGHGLPRVLPGDQPDLKRPGADREHLQRPPVQRGPQDAQLCGWVLHAAADESLWTQSGERRSGAQHGC